MPAPQVVVDIDGDGSFLMNCQEMATAACERLDIKMFILNNQHLGMVVQWEDRFYKARGPFPLPVTCCKFSPAFTAFTLVWAAPGCISHMPSPQAHMLSPASVSLHRIPAGRGCAQGQALMMCSIRLHERMYKL